MYSELSAPRLRKFVLHREEDESGVSGEGVVAVGVVMPSGKVCIEWLNHENESVDTEGNGWAIYESIEDARAIHGHGGKTEFVFGDESFESLARLVLEDMGIGVKLGDEVVKRSSFTAHRGGEFEIELEGYYTND